MKKLFIKANLILVAVLFTACTQKVNHLNTSNSNDFMVAKKYCVDAKVFYDYSKKQINELLEKEVRQDVLFQFLDENSVTKNDSYEEFFPKERVKIDKKVNYFTDDYENYCIEFEARVKNPEFFFNDISLEEYSRQNSTI